MLNVDLESLLCKNYKFNKSKRVTSYIENRRNREIIV